MLDINNLQNYFLIKGDCLEQLKKIPDKSIGLILTDPPYNLSKYSTGNIKFNWRCDRNNDIAEWDEKELNPADFYMSLRELSSLMAIFLFLQVII